MGITLFYAECEISVLFGIGIAEAVIVLHIPDLLSERRCRKVVSPLLKVIPVDWDYSIPHGWGDDVTGGGNIVFDDKNVSERVISHTKREKRP